MGLLIIYAVLAIAFSFLCSILEAVLLSVTPTFLKVKKQEGKKFATALEKMKTDVDKPLIAILTINTIAHTVGAIFVGAQAGALFGTKTIGIGPVKLTYESLIAGLMTIAVLVVSEIIPKTIGATYWKQLSGFTATSLKWMMFPLKWTGIMWLLQLLTKLFGSSHHGSVFSRADYSAMTQEAIDSGALAKSESKIINNLLNLKDVLVKDIMTPRTVMVSANEDTFINNFYKGNKNLRYSRIPLYTKQEDNISGYFLKDEMLQHIIEEDPDMPLATLKRNLLIVKNDMPLPDLFEKLTKQREHLAVVENEQGTLVGLVTMEDVIETLLGLEIMDELDNVADLQKLARQKWEERARTRGVLE